jgi:hypothetical protein
MTRANFCAACGAQLTRKRGWASGRFCLDCAPRFRSTELGKPLAAIAVIAIAAFALGRYLRPAPPPLIIERRANSPLSDAPVTPGNAPKSGQMQSEVEPAAANESVSTQENQAGTASANDVVYICGARTKKGTPCHRRVNAAGERCYQHKGMPAMLPLDKLIIK